MSESRKVLRGTVLLTLGQVASYGLSFARNVILARLLTKADFGLAALFSITIILLEVAGRMSIGQQIIQSRVDSPVFQATSHAFQAVLASFGALLIVAASHPVARIMHVPQLWWAFSTLAVVPLARGFEHLDYYRLQRDLNYVPAVLCDLVPQLLVTAAAWPLAKWLGDFRVIIWLMIGKAVLGTLMTHLLARRAYRWAWDKLDIRGMCAFGLPLFANGFLIFASQQADQMVVGAYLSLEKLASYALAFSLVTIPGNIFAQVGSSLLLPIFSRAQDSPVDFRKHYRICADFSGLASVLLLLPLIVAGGQLATLIYGEKYSGTGPLIAILGTAASIRFLRIVPAIASMAKADTVNQLYSNLFRCISLPLAATVAVLGGGVVLIASCALAAEVAAATVSVVRLRYRQGVPLNDTAGAAGFVIFFGLLGLTLVFLGVGRWGYVAAGGTVAAMLCLAIAVGAYSFPSAMRMLLGAFKGKQPSEFA